MADAMHEAPHEGVELFRTLRAGLGVRASRSFKAGEEVWHECPLMALQHRWNQRCVLTCARCFRVLGNLRSSISRLLALVGKTLESDFPSVAARAELDDVFFALAPPLSCSGGCGEVFCSAQCSTLAMKGAHGFLCGMSVERRQALRAVVER